MSEAAFWSPVITLAVMLAVLAWVVIFDSRKRWPGASLWQRYVSVITLRRR